MPELSQKINLTLQRQPQFMHRSGWAFALEALRPLHSPNGVLFDSFLERTFGWHEQDELSRGMIPYRQPWIGVLHNPPNIPSWHDFHNSPQAILEKRSFQDSLSNCQGLYVLSNYLKEWLQPRVPVPVESLRHPTELSPLQFDVHRFLSQQPRKIVHVGWWLRKISSFFRLPLENHQKILLRIPHPYFATVLSRDLAVHNVSDVERRSVTISPFLSEQEYDEVLAGCPVFCDLYDSSANNTVIECIVRNTPLLINPLPAVREYLGDDYPLYFRSLSEARRKFESCDLVLSAHNYMKYLDKGEYSAEYFCRQVANSAIYQIEPVS
ncbi:hypothetical protein [Rubinisphaera margarita]|uniref:hypothetical protein n=1 Tax=Rubinisphaera margarita TaxID=2909586 RepID=UPI001EE7AF4A|nr:hypothetical protein [Rubinisphaera margarita]MCG6154361.1 hypothetical protein [Rubinisphaera margarita]